MFDRWFVYFKKILRPPPAMLMKVIEDCAAAMDVVLTPVPMETTVTMMPGSEEYQFALGYLLAWQLLLRLFRSASSKVYNTFVILIFEGKIC